MNILALLLACSEPGPSADTAPRAAHDTGPRAPTPGDDTGAVGCDVRLLADALTTNPRGNLRVEVEGGSGERIFSLADNQSGAIVHARSGDYLAGTRSGVTDTVAVEDPLCGVTLEATVQVLPTLLPVPAAAEIPPGTRIPFTAEGGSGSFGCALLSDGSKPLLKGCTYSAGAIDGTDLLEVTDLVTGDTATVTIRVDKDAALTGVERWGLQPGEPIDLGIGSGTGVYDVTVDSGSVVVEGQSVTLSSGPDGMVTVRDRYAPLSLTIALDAITGRSPSEASIGATDTEQGDVWALGDVDGDGLGDVVVVTSDASVAAWEGGAIHLYTSGAAASGDRLGEAQVIGHTVSVSDFGQISAVGDFTDDGRLDLAVGAYYDADTAGAMYVFEGQEDGLFNTEPVLSYTGSEANDQLGWGLVACDFNADGYDDIAVSSPYAEEEYYNTGLSGHGLISLFAGSADGLPTTPVEIWGQIPDGKGGWEYTTNLRIARNLGAGDVDGDGYCDLVAASDNHTAFTDAGDDTDVVLIYRGGEDGLAAEPAAVWVYRSDNSTNLGRGIALGDLDGDGYDDIVLGGGDLDDEYIDQGLVVVVPGVPLPAEADAIEDLDVAWQVRGDSGYDNFGESLLLEDADGDGYLDLFIGEPHGEVDTTGTGAVRVYSGADILSVWGTGHDATDDAPDYAISTDSTAAEYGRAIALADLDGDGALELLSLAAEDNTTGPDVGALYVGPWDGSADHEVHGLHAEPSGQHIGAVDALAFADVDADGADELLVGGWGEGFSTDRDIGAVWVYTVDSSGTMSAEPVQTLGDHSEGKGIDGYGAQVRLAGDVDGDGFVDVAVLANRDDRPSSEPSGYTADGDCLEKISNGGSVQIHRGSADGLLAEPSWITYSDCASKYLYGLAAGMDRDGDGVLEVAFGSPTCDGYRGRLYHGISLDPAAPADTTRIVCGVETLDHADTDRLGQDIVALGDLDGDGCDEMGVSVDYDDAGGSSQGSLRIFWGHGGSGCPTVPEQTVLTREGGRYFVDALAGGADVDGDGVADLVIGEAGYLLGDTDEAGALWLLSGADLVGLERIAVGDEIDDDMDVFYDVRDLARSVLGTEAGGELGAAVAIGDGRVVAGAPGELGGRGAARVYQLRDGALVLEAVLVGPAAGGSRFGSALAVGQAGGVGILAVGAELDEGAGVDNGAVYTWVIP